MNLKDIGKSDEDVIKNLPKKKQSKYVLEDFVYKSIKNSEEAFLKNTEYSKALANISKELFNQGIEALDKSEAMSSYLKTLKEEKLISEYDLGAEYDSIEMKKLIELSEHSYAIFLDEETGNVAYKDNAGKIYQLDFSFDDDVMHRRNIAELLPNVTFDVLQNGDVDKAKEAEAIYKVVVVNEILDGLYLSAIKRTLNGYNFKNLQPHEGEKNFRSLLKTILEEASSTIRIIMGACEIKIAELKTKKEVKILSGISIVEAQELRELKISILAKRNEYAKIIAKEETKARREVKRESLREEERNLIEASSVKTLYRILELNTEAIPMKARIAIARKAKLLAFNLKERSEFIGSDSLVLKLANRLQRRGYREYIAEMKTNLLKELREGKPVEIKTKL